MKAADKKCLKMKLKSRAKYGAFVYAVIANYRGKGKQKLILHELEIPKDVPVAYGHKRHWVFPPR